MTLEERPRDGVVPGDAEERSLSAGPGPYTRDNPAFVIIGRQPTRQCQESTALPSTSVATITDATEALVRRQTRSQTRLE